jgi:peptidyl-prolyl cis-trans isomerase SurA
MLTIKQRQQTIFFILLFGWSGLTAQQAPAVANAASGTLLDRIVAVVNGEVIALSELKEAMALMRFGVNLPGSLTSSASRVKPETVSLEREALNQLIERKVQLQLARKRGISVEPNEIEQLLREIINKNERHTDESFRNALARENLTLERYMKNLEEQLIIFKLATREVKSGILLDEKELHDYYLNHLDRYTLPDEIHIRQILLDLPGPELNESVLEKARMLIALLNNGADFQSLAREHSHNTGGEESGDLGFIKKNQLLPAIEKAIHGLQPGEISDPVETHAGIYILMVEEIREGQHKPFDEVKPLIRETLFQERSAQRYHEWLQDIRNAAQVNIKVQH